MVEMHISMFLGVFFCCFVLLEMSFRSGAGCICDADFVNKFVFRAEVMISESLPFCTSA